MADTNSVADETVKIENEEQENEDDNEVVNNVEGTEAPKKKKKKKKKKKTGKLMAPQFKVYDFVVTDFWLFHICTLYMDMREKKNTILPYEFVS